MVGKGWGHKRAQYQELAVMVLSSGDNHLYE